MLCSTHCHYLMLTNKEQGWTFYWIHGHGGLLGLYTPIPFLINKGSKAKYVMVLTWGDKAS